MKPDWAKRNNKNRIANTIQDRENGELENLGKFRRLWSAVALRALEDGARADWIGSQDFHMVLSFAGLDSESALGRIERGETDFSRVVFGRFR